MSTPTPPPVPPVPPTPQVPPVPPAAPPTPAAPPPPQPPAASTPPAPPAYPPRPPGPTGPPPSQHKSSKAKTIGLIVAGVVVVGTIGGLVGAALGGGDDTDLTTRDPSASATPSPTGTASGILDPSPVGTPTVPTEDPSPTSEPTAPSVEPTEPSVEPTPEPTDEPSLPTQLPTPTPTPPPTADGAVSILGGSVQVALPDGWEVFNQGDSSATITDNHGSYVYAVAGTGVGADVDAAALINDQVANVLPAEQYSGLTFSDITPLDPAGAVTSIAQVEYAGTWVDSQSPIPFHGVLFALVRSDGTAMILTAEHAPPDGFEDALDGIQEAVQPTLAMFAGL